MVSQLHILVTILLNYSCHDIHIICIVLTCAVYYHIAENIGVHKIWMICHERHLATDILNMSLLAVVFNFGHSKVPSIPSRNISGMK